MTGVKRVEAAWKCDDACAMLCVLAEHVKRHVGDVQHAAVGAGEAQHVAHVRMQKTLHRA